MSDQRTLCIMAATLAAGDSGEYSDCGPLRTANMRREDCRHYARKAIQLAQAVAAESRALEAEHEH